MLTQVAKFSPLYDVEIYDASADARGRFHVGDKYDVGGPGAAFEEVAIEVHIVSPAPERAVRELLAHAERACHTSHSLRAPVAVEITFRLDKPET